MRSSIVASSTSPVSTSASRAASGKPLLLLIRMASAGMGIWDAIWDDLARALHGREFRPRRRGRGSSEDLPPRERFCGSRTRTPRCARALGFDDFHVFGWYGGTHVALACMLGIRERVRSALLLDPFFALPDPRKLEKAIAFKRRLFESDDRSLYAYYWVMAGFSPDSSNASSTRSRGWRSARIEADRFVSLDPERWMRWVRALRSNWLTDDELAAMTMPTLVLATSLDSWHAGPTVGMAQALASGYRTPR